ncbi:MAG: membrane protein insertion efficiency factor YidD [Pseudomonadota bacterium]
MAIYAAVTRPTPHQPYGKVAGFCLWIYKQSLSRVFFAFGARCRHLPTCSEYAAGAVSAHGIWPGAWMTVARLLRCQPFGSEGYDPVPDIAKGARWWKPWQYGDWAWTVRPFPQTEETAEAQTRETPSSPSGG